MQSTAKRTTKTKPEKSLEGTACTAKGTDLFPITLKFTGDSISGHAIVLNPGLVSYIRVGEEHIPLSVPVVCSRLGDFFFKLSIERDTRFSTATTRKLLKVVWQNLVDCVTVTQKRK